MRGRNNNRPKGPNPLTRSYESNGPDVKIRGNAQHIADKYAQLARDALASGDPIAAENYFQHGEHYFRIITGAAQEQGRPQAAQGYARNGFDEDEDGDDEGVPAAAEGGRQGFGYGGEEYGDPTQAPQPFERHDFDGRRQDRNDRNNDRGNDRGQQRFQGRDRNDRGNDRGQRFDGNRPDYNRGGEPRQDFRGERQDRQDRNQERGDYRQDRGDRGRQDFRQDYRPDYGQPQEGGRSYEGGRQDGGRQDGGRQDGGRPEQGRRDFRQDRFENGRGDQDAARQEPARQDYARQESPRPDVSRQDASRQEASRQEPARQEFRQEAPGPRPFGRSRCVRSRGPMLRFVPMRRPVAVAAPSRASQRPRIRTPCRPS
ncbi:DUF4167 domain-containing protein [Methylorubrum suomiense]